MRKFASLLKLEFLSNMSRFKDDKLFTRIRRAGVTLIGALLMAALFLFAINSVMKVFLATDLQQEFLTLFCAFMGLVFFVLGIIMVTKIFYLKTNLSLLKLPVSGTEIFAAKCLYVFLRELLFSFLIALPVFILFGIKTAQGALFYVMLLPNVLFLPVIPFLLSILMSVPVMWIIRTFKNQFLVLFVFYTILLVGAFVAYIFVLKFVLQMLDDGDFANFFDLNTVRQIRRFAAYLYLPALWKNSLLLYRFWHSAAINLALVCVLGLLVFWFASKCYLNVIYSSMQEKSFSKNIHVKHQKESTALFSKEFKNIFRSTNYAFQYLTIVITTPLMVYFSSEVASSVGTPMLGSGTLPGIVVLVMIMFLSMNTSFSATSITREGENFFLTKIIPVKFTKQVAVKFAIYIFISIPAIFISCFVLSFAGFIDYLAAFLIGTSLSFVAVGSICHSISLDIRRPQFQYLENGEIASSNKNVSASIGLGFAIAILMGVGAIIISSFVNVPTMYLVLFAFGVPFAAIEIFHLFFHLEKRYNEIEV